MGKAAPRKSVISDIYRQRYLLLMLLPTLAILVLFTYKPIVGWVIAFKDYRPGFTMWEGEWIGFSAFREFFIDSTDAVGVIRNTLVMNIGSIVANLFMGMVFAILLNEIKNKFFKSAVQTLSLFPFFISWVIVYSIMTVFLSSNSGLINVWLVESHILKEGLNILGSPAYSWGLVIAANLWKALGYIAIIFLATIAGIDTNQYEAAEIDGAGRWAKIRFITIPNLMPTLMVLLILNSGMVLNSNFEQYYLLVNPTNVSTMDVFDTYIYKYGLKLGNFSYATAVSMLKTFFSITVLIAVNMIFKRVYNRSLF